jgi:hypothetical protein
MNRENPLNAPLADGVRRVGFRKWYERELLSSHAHMVLAFLAVIALLGSFEAMRGATAGDQPLHVLGLLASAAIGIWALRRYLFLLMRAEEVANQANCADCGTYGRFRIVGENRDGQQTHVCCLKCQHNWTISLGA